MQRLKRIILHTIRFLKAPILVGVFIFIISCENDIQEIRVLTAKQDSAIYSAQNVEIRYSSNGKPTGLMEAPVLNRFVEGKDKSYIEFPAGTKMYFYSDSGNVTSTIKSNYSIYYEDEGRWIAKYDVEVVNESGEKLNTEYLVWLRNEGIITSDQFVKVTTDDGIIYGDDGFKSNQTFTNWEVINGRGVIDIETDDSSR